MKLFAILCLIGLAASSSLHQGVKGQNKLKWLPGKTYTYEYSGRLLNGLPQLANHFSGLGIKCKVSLIVGQANQPDVQELEIKITEPQFVRVSQVLKSGSGDQTPNNWRHVPLPSFNSVPSPYREMMLKPAVFKLTNSGRFISIVVSRDDSEWSVNFKKALVNLFQTQHQESYSNLDQSVNMVKPDSSSNLEPLSYWTTQEESLDGICKVTYQLNQLPSYMLNEKPDQVPYPSICPSGSKVYELVKTRDVSSCTTRTSFSYHKPGSFRCSTGNCEGMWSKSSITRYVVCKDEQQGRQQSPLYSIQSIVNEGELQQNLFGFNTEKFLTGTWQSLKLVHSGQSYSGKNLPYPSNGVELKNLFSERRPSGVSGPSASKTSSRKAQLTGMDGQDPDLSNLIPQLKSLYKQIVEEDLFNVVDIASKQITFKGLSIARAISLLPKQSIKNMYEEIKSSYNSEQQTEMFQNVFFDTLVMGGSTSNIQALKDFMLGNEMTRVQKISTLTFLPRYVITPTQGLLESLFELITSHHIKQDRLVYQQAILSYSQLIQNACLSQNRKTSYPTWQFGSFCNSDSNIVLTRWIPYLQDQLYQVSSNEERNVILVALGLMSHKNVIPTLVPFIENINSRSSRSYDEMTRFIAIYSFGNVGREYPQLVAPIVSSVLSNIAESTEIRIAAFNVLLRLNPDMSYFHKIAESTWYEKDSEVLQVVNTAFFSLSEECKQQKSVSSQYNTINEKAWLVYPLIKKTSGTVPTSGSIFSSDFLSKLGVGYNSVKSWTSNRRSIVPSQVYYRIAYFLDRLQMTPVEFGANLKGAWNVGQQIIEILNPKSKQGQTENEIYQEVKKQLHSEWSQVIEKLQLKSRSNGPTETALYMNLFEDSPMFYSFQASTNEILKEKLSSMLNPHKIKAALKQGNNNFNFQRVVDLSPNEFNIPSDMGLPIFVEIHTPVVISARGSGSHDVTGVSKNVQYNVKTLFAFQITGYVGTLCPFTGEFVATGVDEHSLLSLPADISINFNTDEQKLKVKLQALDKNEPIDLFHYHIRPFSVHQKYYDLKPMTLSQNFKLIESPQPLQRIAKRFGENYGMDLQFVLHTETPFLDFRTAVHKFEMFNRNPLNFITFGWAATALNEEGNPSFRRHEVQLKYNPGASKIKEYEIQGQVGYASKQKSQDFKFHATKHLINGAKQGVLPFEIVSNTLGQYSRLQEQQSKIKELTASSQVEEGQAITVHITTTTRGSGRQVGSSKYVFTGLTGSMGSQQKWNAQLESSSSSNKICVNGHLNIPKLPVWNIKKARDSSMEFNFWNEIGFGSNCQESKVIFNGLTKSNQEQKDYSRKSPEARELEKLQQRGAPAPEIGKLSEKVLKQASILNEVEFSSKYENVPSKYMWFSKYALEVMKSEWWPYLEPSSARSQANIVSNTIINNYRIVFSPNSQTFNLYVTTPRESFKFVRIYIPYPLTYLFPVVANRNSLKDMTKQITGKSFYPTCKVNGNFVETYDNNTVPLKLDECYHLLTGDCSHQKTFGVLVRKSPRHLSGARDMIIYLRQTKVQLITENFSRVHADIKVVVNNTRHIDVKTGQYTLVQDNLGNIVFEVSRSNDGAILIKSPLVYVQFNGRRIAVEASYLNKNTLCGLCGDLNDNRLADLRGPKQCVYSKPELLVASYRVPLSSQSCAPLPDQVQQSLDRETEQCAKYKVLPTKLAQSLKNVAGKCIIHEHQVVYRANDVCFSQIPLARCGLLCKKGSITQKWIPFTCLPHGHLADLYARRARAGKILPELKNLPETYKSETFLPHCVPLNTDL